MLDYREIDHLLLNVNKGPAVNSSAGSMNQGLPRPGDRVMVSVGDRGLLNVLIHRANQENHTLMGEIVGAIQDVKGREIIGAANEGEGKIINVIFNAEIHVADVFFGQGGSGNSDSRKIDAFVFL